MSSLSAEPAINVRPAIGGTEIAVRYITNAHDRGQMRAKLNQVLVDLLGAKEPAPAPLEVVFLFPFWKTYPIPPIVFGRVCKLLILRGLLAARK